MADVSLSLVVRTLLARGVMMPHPQSVDIDSSISPERIAPQVVIHAGCRLRGATTSIGPGCVLGAEGPLTLEDSQLGANVELRGGFVSGATMLDGAILGSGAHVRSGTLMEEESSGAHAVGLKQAILFPYVTLGSIINFCDVLMAGGTSRKNHGEVGSSFIHFNFTPHQDKATASLIGDVPRGVFLDQPPTFLGGQGGVVGPARIGFGCVTPAGTVFRGDATGDGFLLHAPAMPSGSRPYRSGVYRGAARIWRNNLEYIGNIRALRAWYKHVRAPFVSGIYHRLCWEGALRRLEEIEKERLKRLEEWVTKLRHSADALRAAGDAAAEADMQESIVRRWPQTKERLSATHDDVGARDAFLREVEAAREGRDYLEVVPSLPKSVKAAGTAWLQGFIDAALAAGSE